MAKRLLIVDDEETLAFSLYQSFILAKHDFEVVTASDGDIALEKITEKPFDLIISDIKMPGLNGFDLLKAVRENYPETHVLLMTAYGSDEYRQRAYEEGAIYYIEKPFDMKEIKQKVFEILI